MDEQWTLTFPNEQFTGASASAVLKQLSKTQFAEDDRANIKRALAWRAYVLTQEMLNEHDPDDVFLRRVCELGLAILEVESNGNVERIERTDWS